MPNESIEKWIPDYSDKPEVRETLGRMADLLHTVLEYGAQVLTEGFERTTGSYQKLVPYMLFRHILELLDSVAHNVRQASVEPCELLLRGMLEGYLQLEYMLQDRTDERGLAFLVCWAHDHIRFLKMMDPSTEAGKSFKAEISKDPALESAWRWPMKGDRRVETVERALRSGTYQSAEEEYQTRKKAQRGRQPRWYSFYEGPNNLRELARCLGKGVAYDVFYRLWSGLTHAQQIISGKLSRDGRRAEVMQLRNPEEAQDVTTHAAGMGLWCVDLVVRKYLFDRQGEFAEWRRREIDPHLKEFSGKRIFKVS